MINRLTELGALSQHIELNEAGWWDKTAQNLILSFLHLHDESMSVMQIVKGINEEYDTKFDYDRVYKVIDNLLHDGKIIVLDDKYKLSQEHKEWRDGKERQSTERDNRLIERFGGKLLENGFANDPYVVWHKFTRIFLTPLTEEMGVKMFHIITGTSLDLEKYPSFDAFLAKFDETDRPFIRKGVLEFFLTNDPDLRSYVIQLINMVLVLESTALSQDKIRSLYYQMAKNPVFRIFIDTNFFFHLIGLDESGFHEAADLLKDVVINLNNVIDIKLYITPITLSEAREKLIHEKRNLKNLDNSENAALAVLQSGQTSGLREQFFRSQVESNTRISAETYFNAYIDNLLFYARENNIDIYQDRHIEEYKDYPKVTDDVFDLTKTQENNQWKNQKSKAVLEHDCILWHFALDKRPQKLSSPTDATYWIVTTDRQFINYDRSKRRSNQDMTPVCIFPGDLIQMLRLWIPRSQKYEDAIISSIRPFLQDTLDSETEQTSLTILNHISVFEKANPNPLPQEVIFRTLTNSSLRQRLNSSNLSDAKRYALVKDEVSEQLQIENQALKHQAELSQQIIAEFKTQVETITDAKHMSDEELASTQSKVEELTSQLNTATASLQNTDAKLKELESTVSLFIAEREVREKKDRLSKDVLEIFFIPVILFASGSFISSHLLSIVFGLIQLTLNPWLFLFVTTSLFYLLLRRIAEVGSKKEAISETAFFRTFNRFYGVIVIIVNLSIAVLSSAIYDILKSIILHAQ